MTRFVTSTCGILAEVAVIDAATSAWMIGTTVVGLSTALVIWWFDAHSIVDRIVGLDLSDTGGSSIN